MTNSSARPQTYDHLKSRKKPIKRSVWIALDSEVADDLAEVSEKVARLKIRAIARKDDTKLQAELAEAEDNMKAKEAELRDGNAMKFVFRAIGRRRYDDLLGEHAPTPAQLEEARAIDPNGVLEFNPDTFPQELVAASIVSPELSKSEVNDIFQSEDWNAAELSALFETALLANTIRRTIDLGNGSRGTNGSGSN